MDLAAFARGLGAAIADADAHGSGEASAFLRGPVRESIRHLRHVADQLPIDRADALRAALADADASGAGQVAVDRDDLRRLLQPAPITTAPADCRECPYHPTPADPATRRPANG